MFWNRSEKPHVHLVGIGGSGMSGIAEVLLASGFPVSGSDLKSSAVVERLQQSGACVFEGHCAENVGGASVVVVSSAVSQNNEEVIEAKKRKIPVIARAEMLAELMRLKRGIAVAGSHGKTTTTTFLGQLLQSLDPTVVVGGRVQHWGASSLVGKGNLFVIEADESDKSFLKFSPVYSIVTNVDTEHIDNYKDDLEIDSVFVEFMNRTAFFGRNWICGDCERLRALRNRVSKPLSTYGFGKENDLQIHSLRFQGSSSFFSLRYEQNELGEFEIPMVGEHNVLNAAGAVGVALSLQVSVRSLRRRLRDFHPAERRFQIHYQDHHKVVIEDYAHHPTEIEAVFRSVDLMFPGRPLKVLFQPHRYSRTEGLWKDFVRVLNRPLRLSLLPVYAAHEKPREGVTSEKLLESLDRAEGEYWEELPSPEKWVEADYQETVYLILGAAPLTEFALSLARYFQRLPQQKQAR